MNARIGDLAGRGFTSVYQSVILKRPAKASHLLRQPNRNGSNEDRVMAKRQLPSPEVLRQLLRYDPETGRLFWKERTVDQCKSEGEARRWNGRFAGKEILSTSSYGYRVFTISSDQFPAHRACFAIFHGRHPEGDIDHVNGDRADNRIANLREATKRENAVNRKLISRNSTGVCGVSRTRYGTYIAYISTASGRVHLGTFKTIEDAEAARKPAEKLHGYSEGHGRLN